MSGFEPRMRTCPRLLKAAGRKQFYCTNMRLRWDRIGRPLVYPAYAAPDPLDIATAKVSWDGHVLLFPGVAAFGTRILAMQLWPHWSPAHR